jgi:hypothetical protein
VGGIEEVGKIASSMVSTFRAQPLSLALVLMNVALLVLVAYNAREVSNDRRRTTETIVGMIAETSVLLSKCISAEELGKLLRETGKT